VFHNPYLIYSDNSQVPLEEVSLVEWIAHKEASDETIQQQLLLRDNIYLLFQYCAWPGADLKFESETKIIVKVQRTHGESRRSIG